MTQPEGERPIIVVVDQADDLPLVVSECTARYGAHYRVIAAAGLAELSRLLRHDEEPHEVALVLANHADDGVATLRAARALHPHARRALLVGWSEERARREAVVATLDRGDADVVIVRPLAPGDERFHRAVTETLDEWWRLCGVPYSSVVVVGDPDSARVHEMQDALHRHDIAYEAHPADSTHGRSILDAADASELPLPVVVVRDGPILTDPSNLELAEALGARIRPRDGVYDVAIVGGGPAGLAAAVYAASEGLRTALLERQAMGGQAGTSSMIRNYLGFPRGISGAELAARAFEQAVLFGTDMVYGGDVVGLDSAGGLHRLTLAAGGTVDARAVVLATGVSYRMLDAPELTRFLGRGVFYGAAMSEARGLRGEHAVVVGGGNSAGQAALHLARFADRVTLAVRSDSLTHSMSAYLLDDVERAHNIEVRHRCEVVGGSGERRLETVLLRDRGTGAVEEVPARAVFALIGAQPPTDWLPPSVRRDDHGYVVTDGQFATSCPGVFAVGDVRSASVKRVASAAGEGAVAVRFVHDHLARTPVPAQRTAAPSTTPAR